MLKNILHQKESQLDFQRKDNMSASIIIKLNEIIKERKDNPCDSSYTCQLFKSGDNKLIKKLGEENAELIKALLTETEDKIAGEAADCIYHIMVALRHKNIDFLQVLKVLEERHAVKSSNK